MFLAFFYKTQRVSIKMLLESSWDALGRLLGRFWGVLGRSWGALGRLGALLGRSWALLGRSWGALGGVQKGSQEGLNIEWLSWAILEPFWDRFGCLLGRSWGGLGDSWDALGRS